jgi:transcriptional regulator with PAS, ATPase and Fis domain
VSGGRWWDLEFFPLHDDTGLLCILGKIAAQAQQQPIEPPVLPPRLVALRESVAQRYGLENLASQLPAFARIIEQVRLASGSTVPVLLVGEPGTGKQWLARTIHHLRAGNEGPFIALNCAALPPPLLSAVLAGTPRCGTYYFQEPACLPGEEQVRLRDLLAEGGVGPRVLVSCCSDPREQVRTGRLREDLYCAVSPLVIAVPPLRERQADMPALVERLLERVNALRERSLKGLTPEAWELMRAYRWPGNLKELLAVLRKATEHSADDLIDVTDLPAALRLAVRLEETSGAVADKALPLDQLLEEAERRLIVLALRKARGNRSRAAEILSVWRPRLLRRIEALGIKDG